MRTMAIFAVPLLLSGALAACTKSTDQNQGTQGGACKIALLLPENATPRYEAADKPYFEAEVAAEGARLQGAVLQRRQRRHQAEAAGRNGADAGREGTRAGRGRHAGRRRASSRRPRPRASRRSRTTAPRTARSAYEFTFNAQQVGELQGQALVDAMTKAGVAKGAPIVMINGDTAGSRGAKFKQGAHSVIDASGYKVGAEYDTPKWSPDTATTEMSQAITKVGKDNIKGVYVANDTMAGAAINAMQQAGITPLPPVTGQDAAIDGLQRILLGTQTMTIYKALKKLAIAAADAAIAVAKGKPVTGTTTTVTNATGRRHSGEPAHTGRRDRGQPQVHSGRRRVREGRRPVHGRRPGRLPEIRHLLTRAGASP